MRLRLRTPRGQFSITLSDEASIGDLLAQIKEKSLLSHFDIKFGYPPQPLELGEVGKDSPLSGLEIKLNGETLIINPKEEQASRVVSADAITPRKSGRIPTQTPSKTLADIDAFSFESHPENSKTLKPSRPIGFKKKSWEGDVPELPLPDRGATLVLRVMPDDNSCLFRAFGTAVLPGDDLSVTELRSLVASAIQGDPETYTNVVLEQEPDDYCRWIQTTDAWGGAIEMGILSKHFDLEVCSIDVQSLRIDRFSEGRPTRCILVYSGIHYDTIVQSPSEPPHTKSDSPPEFDKRVWDSDDDEILIKSQLLCQKLQEKHYFTDTGGMAIKCNICGTIVHGEAQAAGHASQTGHYDMGEVST